MFVLEHLTYGRTISRGATILQRVPIQVEKGTCGEVCTREGKELIGTFNRAEDAVAEGARRFGSESFLVRHVDHAEEELYIPALALGILDARSTQPI